MTLRPGVLIVGVTVIGMTASCDSEGAGDFATRTDQQASNLALDATREAAPPDAARQKVDAARPAPVDSPLALNE